MQKLLQGQSFSRVSFDYAVVLETDAGAEVRIESVFRLTSDGTQTREVDPERLDQVGDVVARVLRQEIEWAQIDDSGALSIRFANGFRLDCEPDEQFEAWTLATAVGALFVCLPGGGVAEWPESSNSS